MSLSSSSLSILQPILHPHAQKIKERERERERDVPGLILESGLPSSKGTEAILSEVKPVFKITCERDT